MSNRVLHLLVLCTVAMGLLRTNQLDAEALPLRALARIGGPQLYHGPGIGCAALSADGKRVASAAMYWNPEEDYFAYKVRDEYNRIIIVWDAATGEQLRELRVPPGIYGVARLAFSPDGKFLAAAYTTSKPTFNVAVFSVETGKLLRRMENFENEINAVRFSLDGKQLSVSEVHGPISAWDPSTGKQLRRWKPPLDEPAACDEKPLSAQRGTLSPDGKVIVWEMGYRDVTQGAQGYSVVRLRVHDAATNRFLYRKNAEHQEGDLVFSADGKRIAISVWDKLLVWDTATGKNQKTIGQRYVFHFALTTDGCGVVLPADLEEGPASGEDSNREVTIRYVETGKPVKKLSLGFAADYQFELLPLSGLPAFSADGKTLLLDVAPALRLFDTATGKERFRPIHCGPVLPRFSSDGRTLLTSCLARKCRWDISGKVPRLLTEERRKTSNPSDVKTEKTLEGIKAENGIGDPVFSPDSRLVALANGDGSVQLYHAVEGKTVRTLRSSKPLPEGGGSHAHLCFSPDGKRLIVTVHNYSGDNYLQQPTRVFDLSREREILRFYANPRTTNKAAELSCMCCSPDGRLLAVGEKYSGTIRLIELASGTVRAEFTGHRYGIHGLAFSPDGKMLASGGLDHAVFLWDVTGARTPSTAEPAKESDLTAWWNDLASVDGQRAAAAIAGLLHNPELSAAYLQKQLQPKDPLSEKRLAQLIADLDSDAFPTRETASRELTRLGERVEAALRRELTNRPSLEMRRRIEFILDKLESAALSPETLRVIRAVEVLEHLDTPAARHCLAALSKGTAEARAMCEAKAALQRRANRR